MSPMANLPLKEAWEKVAKAVSVEAELSGSDNSREIGKLTWSIKLDKGSHRDFRDLLLKYMSIRETPSIDPDSFDMAYYNYGMERYGNMPLIEEQEGREEKRLESLVIAIDTSASTKRRQVAKFMREIYGLFSQRENFFDRIQIHLIECDDRIQNDIEITNINQIEAYEKEFVLSGGYGTDYRPVFAKIRDLRKDGKLSRLKALLYFTDGYGIYPKKVTDYDTAFVFIKGEDFDDTSVPEWAMKLYM